MNYLILTVSLYLVYHDIRFKKVPNIILLLLFLIVILGKIFMEDPIIPGLISGLVAFFTFVLIHFISGGKLGMGDCKYTAVIAFQFGYIFWLKSIIYCSTIALIISLILLFTKVIDRKTAIPFIPFLVLGGVFNYIIPLPLHI